MAFPSVTATATSVTNPANATHSPTLPTHVAGQLLVVFGGKWDSQTNFADQAAADAGNGWKHTSKSSVSVLWKVAESSSETLSLTLSASRQAVFTAYAIDDADQIIVAYGSSRTDPPSLATGTSRDYLWLAAATNHAGSATAATAPPTNYSNLVVSTIGSDIHVYSAERQLNAATENPGAFAVTTTGSGASLTVACYKESTGVRTFQDRMGWRVVGKVSPISNYSDYSSTMDGWKSVKDNASTELKGENQLFSADTQFQQGAGPYAWEFTAGTVDQGFAEWNGTAKDLGILANESIVGISSATIWYRVTRFTATPTSFALADLDGSGGAFEFIVDPLGSPTSHVMIPDQAKFTGTTSSSTPAVFTNSPAITGLSIAVTDTIRLRQHIDFNAAGSNRVKIVRMEIVFDVTTAGPVDLASTTTAVSTVTSALTVTPPPINFAATVNAVSTVTSALTVTSDPKFNSTVNAVSNVTASLAVARQFQSTTNVVSTVNGALFFARNFEATVTAVSTVSASLGVTRQFNSTTNVVSTVSGAFQIVRLLAATVTAVSNVTATLAVTRSFESTTNVVSTVTVGAFINIVLFESTTNVVSTVSAQLKLAPHVIDIATTAHDNSTGQPHGINMPSHSTGDFLVLLASASAPEGITVEFIGIDDSLSGWSTLLQKFAPGGGPHIFYKQAESNTETLLMRTAAPSTAHLITTVYSIRNANTIAGQWGPSSGSSEDADPVEFNPDSTIAANDFGDDYFLWIAGMFTPPQNNGGFRTAVVASSPPSGYSDLTTITTTQASADNGPSLSTAHKNTTETRTEDPGAFTSADSQWLAITLPIWNREEPNLLTRTWQTHSDGVDNLAGTITTVIPELVPFMNNVNTQVFERVQVLSQTSHAEANLVRLNDDDTSEIEDGYWEFDTTFAELGLQDGSLITGILSASFWWAAHNTLLGATEVSMRDAVGSGGAMELIINDSTSIVIFDDLPPAVDIGTHLEEKQDDLISFTASPADTVKIRFHIYIERNTNDSNIAGIKIDQPSITFAIGNEVALSAVVAATSTVTVAGFDRQPKFASTTNVVSTVTGNIDATRKLMSAVVVESATIVGNLERLVDFVSTTNVITSTTANLGLTVFFDSTTNVVSAVDVGFLNFGFEATVNAVSTVTANLVVQRDMSTTVQAQSTVTPTLQRAVDYSSVTNVASALFSTLERDVPFEGRSDSVGTSFGRFTLAAKFSAVVQATSTIDSQLARLRTYSAVVPVNVTVFGNIVQGLRFMSTTVVESATIVGNLERLVPFNSITNVVSDVIVATFDRNVKFEASVAVVSTVTGIVVVITNTLNLTLLEGPFFTEVADRVLRLTTTSEESVHIITEVDELTIIPTEVLPDVIVADTTDN